MSEFDATLEQSAIINAPLEPIVVVACPGSGKTATAVRRVAEVRRRLDEEGSRGHVALLSFSNVAVDTFRTEYRKLRGRDGDTDRVAIQTMDSFIAMYILKPHGARVMRSTRVPFLVHGGEPFLSSYRFGTDPKKLTIGIDELVLDLENEEPVIHRRFKRGGSQRLDQAHTELALEQIKKLAKSGGYTYATGRGWARRLLLHEPRVSVALARRFPQILVDEAQDIGRFESALLDILSAHGSTISLVGDFKQSIYGFNFATGEHLRDFAKRPGVLSLPLTQNRRSLDSIVNVANSLAGTSSKHFRDSLTKPTGAFFWTYEPEALPQLMSSWVGALNAAGYLVGDAAVLCRGGALLAKLLGESNMDGRQSAVKHFANAAIEREQDADISKVLEHCAKGVMAIVSGLPDSFVSDVRNVRGDPKIKALRRLIWPLIRSPETGIPSATLSARTAWLIQLKKNLEVWLTMLEQETSYNREATWGHRVTASGLPKAGPLMAVDVGQNDWSGMRCGTVHSAKGEGISAVMYLTENADLRALVEGTETEEGRIGFVAATRARDLLVVAIPKKAPVEVIAKLRAHGFRESSPVQLSEAAALAV